MEREGGGGARKGDTILGRILVEKYVFQLK